MATILPACPDCSPDCYNYIQATVCSGQADGAPDVWVKNITPTPSPSTRYFGFADWCYSVDFSATPAAPPSGAVTLKTTGSTFTDCTNCKDSYATNDHHGGGPGGDEHPLPGGELGLHAVGPLPNVWITCPPNGLAARCYFRFGGDCYYVDPGTCTGFGGAAVIVNYYDCHPTMDACTGGVAPTICAGQFFWTAPKQVWLSSAPAAPVFFQYEGVCYSAYPNSYAAQIPAGAKVIDPDSEFTDCNDCISGAMATLCDGQEGTENAPQLWIPQGKLPPEGDMFIWRAGGFCYSIDSDAEIVSRPSTAWIFTACASQFETCADCLCGPAATVTQGVKVRRCGGGGKVSLPDLWVAECNLPPERFYFSYQGVCVYVEPTETAKAIPSSALLIVPQKIYKNCADCRANNGNEPPDCPNGQHWNGSTCVDDDDPTPCATGWHWNGSTCIPDEPNDHDCPDGEYWDGTECVDISEPCADGYYWNGVQCVANPPPGTDPGCAAGYTYNPDTGKCEPNTTPPPPGEPPPPTPPDDDWDQLQLKDCRTGSLVSKYVSRYSGAAGKIIRDGTSCYEVTSLRSMGGGDTSGPLYYSCSHCLADVQFIQYLKCSDDSASTYYARVIDWIQSGKSVKKIGDECYYINAANTREDELPEGATDAGAPDKTSCDDSDCQVFDCVSETPCHDCCFSDNSTVTGDVSYFSGSWFVTGCSGSPFTSTDWRVNLANAATARTSAGSWLATGVEYYVGGVKQTNDQTDDGTYFAVVGRSCDTGKWAVTVYTNYDGTNPSGIVVTSPAINGDCCGSEESDTGCVDGGLGSSRTTITGTFMVNNNHCCNDSGTCTKADGDCDGACNPLP